MAGIKIDVFVILLGNPWNKTETEESESFARAIIVALKAARMDVAGWVLESCVPGTSAANVSVSVVGTVPGELEIATEILEALKQEVETYPEIQTFVVHPFCAKVTPLDKSDPTKRRHGANISITVGRRIASILTPQMVNR
jgi:hypothetical protein